MKTVYIKLGENPQDIQNFVDGLSGLKGNFDLIDGNYILDARSLLGIFGFDLTRPIQLRMEIDSPENLNAINQYIVKN